MTFIWAPRDCWLLLLAQGWRLCDGAHEPHAQAAEYAVLMWRAEE
jgi:hypothetical protein